MIYQFHIILKTLIISTAGEILKNKMTNYLPTIQLCKLYWQHLADDGVPMLGRHRLFLIVRRIATAMTASRRIIIHLKI